ncbi:hypothetical protein [Lentzea sp. NPDC059081]|uniref:hypothetical protein n=1 Tax=Lentzea sp. NPDC059081 TaxID=3346719 RepID=UPI0036836F32
MEEENDARDDGPEREEQRRPNRSSNSERTAVVLTVLVQVVTLIGQISDLFR